MVLLGCLLSACSTSNKVTREKVTIPEVNLLEIDYYSDTEIDEEPVSLIVLSNLRGKVGYPAEARKRGLEGEVIVEVLISSEGKSYITSLKESVHPILDNQVIYAIKDTKFQPGTLNGKPVNVLTTIPVNFYLPKNIPENFQ